MSSIPATTGTASVPDIPIRNVRFDLSDVPKHWHGAGAAVTMFFDNLSVFFPVGERYFVTTMKAFRSSATTAALRAEVDAFCAQEGHHSREHVRYNQWLEKWGYPIKSMESGVARAIARARKRFSPRRQLASTAALEHFTAMLATQLLDHPEALEEAHPVMAALWRWHAAEESEHKAVAFDLYQAAGGTYTERTTTMLTVTALFWSRVLVQQARMMASEDLLFSPGEWADLVSFLFVKPGGLRHLIWPYLEYFSPSFHPNRQDTQALTARWRAQFASEAIYREAVTT